MNYEDMLKTENTDYCFDVWSGYREELTDYIISSVEDFYRKKKLTNIGKRQFQTAYDMEQISEELAAKPTLAIWGAGGCNDIDLLRLANYFRLVLIDHNMERIQAAKDRYGLKPEDCLLTDLKFWDISKEDYLMFEALMKDKAPIDEVEEYIVELIHKVESIDYSLLPNFDFSVAVGLFSQLNSRFAALAHLHQYSENLSNIFIKLNKCAMEATMRAIKQMTDKALVVGYEEKVLYDIDVEEARELIDIINEEREETLFNRAMEALRMVSEVSGNDELCRGVLKEIEIGKFECVSHKSILWPFTSDKFYIMNVLSLEIR